MMILVHLYTGLPYSEDILSVYSLCWKIAIDVEEEEGFVFKINNF